MTKRYASNRNARAICDRCGLTYGLQELRCETKAGVRQNLLVCDDCYDPDHPQDRQIPLPLDAEALRNPRPDTKPGR